MAEKQAIGVVPDTASSDSPSDGLPRSGDVEGKHPHQVHAAMHNGGAVRDANFFTRNGLNFESFKMRSYGEGIVELDRSMKHRHLQMIAIGESTHPIYQKI